MTSMKQYPQGCNIDIHKLTVTNACLIECKTCQTKEIMLGSGNLVNSPGLVKLWILKENLQPLLMYFYLFVCFLFETFLEDVMKSLMSFCYTALLSKGRHEHACDL